jgi:integrase
LQTLFTTAWLAAELRKPRAKATDYSDTKSPLTLRITPAGGASWSTRRVLPDGRYGRVSLGSYPAIGISEARRRALQAQGLLQAGRDPVAEKRAIKAKAIADRNRVSVSTAWRAYADAKTASGRWGAAHARNAGLFYLRVIAPAFATRALADITRADWTGLVADCGRHGTGAKATALRLIRGFDAYAEMTGWIPHAVLPRKSGALAPACAPRQHTPTDSDIIGIWNAAAALRPKARIFIRLLILTAARRGEVSDIRAGEIDLDACLWRLPAGRSKNKTAHVMPLSALALEELKSVWPSAQVPPNYYLLGGRSGLQDFSAVKRELDRAIGNYAWRLHDLRRAARTTMARLGIPSDFAESALNHTSHRSVLEKTYNTHAYENEKLHALRIWQAHVERLLDPTPDTAEVVPLRRAG